jgi:Mn-containing catalase
VVGAVLGGMDPQQAIVAGGGALLADSNGYPWNGRYIVASGNLLADFRANAAAEAQGRLQTARLYNMTDDPGVKNMLKFNLARDTLHQNLWLKAIEELQADGLETTVAPNALFDEEYAEHATSVWHLSDGSAGQTGGWAAGPQPDGMHEFGYLMDPEPLGEPASPPPPDPALYATYDGSMGKPKGPVMGTETGPIGKIKDALT